MTEKHERKKHISLILCDPLLVQSKKKWCSGKLKKEISYSICINFTYAYVGGCIRMQMKTRENVNDH